MNRKIYQFWGILIILTSFILVLLKTKIEMNFTNGINLSIVLAFTLSVSGFFLKKSSIFSEKLIGFSFLFLGSLQLLNIFLYFLNFFSAQEVISFNLLAQTIFGTNLILQFNIIQLMKKKKFLVLSFVLSGIILFIMLLGIKFIETFPFKFSFVNLIILLSLLILSIVRFNKKQTTHLNFIFLISSIFFAEHLIFLSSNMEENLLVPEILRFLTILAIFFDINKNHISNLEELTKTIKEYNTVEKDLQDSETFVKTIKFWYEKEKEKRKKIQNSYNNLNDKKDIETNKNSNGNGNKIEFGLDKNKKIIFISANIIEILEYTSKELIESKLGFSLFLNEKENQKLELVIGTKKNDLKLLALTKNKKNVTLKAKCNKLFDAENEIRGYRGSLEDITRIDKFKNKIHNLETILNENNDPIIVISKSNELFFANKAFSKLFNLKTQKLKSKKISDIISTENLNNLPEFKKITEFDNIFWKEFKKMEAEIRFSENKKIYKIIQKPYTLEQHSHFSYIILKKIKLTNSKTEKIRKQNIKNIENKLKKLKDLPSLSPIANKLMQMVTDKSLSMGKISDIIKHDPTITVKILRIANSAYFAIGKEISTVKTALIMLGMKEISNIIMGLSLIKSFSNIEAAEGMFSLRDFWYHSSIVAHISSFISQELNLDSSGREFTAGLIHDIGKIIFQLKFKNEYEIFLRNFSEIENRTIKNEKEFLGITHEKVGSIAGKNWDLPEALVDTIENHHLPLMAKNKELASLIGLADLISKNIETENFDELISKSIFIEHLIPNFEVDDEKRLDFNTWKDAIDLEYNHAKEFINVSLT